MSKIIYKIKQEYDVKDYVEYYQSRNHKGEMCNEQVGYINSVEYRVDSNGEIKLRYSIGSVLGSSCGYIVPQEAIIGKVTKEGL